MINGGEITGMGYWGNFVCHRGTEFTEMLKRNNFNVSLGGSVADHLSQSAG